GEGEPVNDGGAKPRIGERLGPARERLVGRDRDRRAFLALGEHLEEQFGAAAVEFHVAELVDLCGYPHRSIYAEVAIMRSCAAVALTLPDGPRVWPASGLRISA